MIAYTAQELQSMIDYYKHRYGDRVEWEVIFQNIKTFQENRRAILTNSEACLAWQGFLHYLIWIESTIGLFGYKSKGSLHRVFVKFGRAYLEEKDVIRVTAGTDKELTWIFDSSRFFKAGNGKKGDIDLHDAMGVTYDVKNDSISFDRAHDANFLLKYRSLDGVVELHKHPDTSTGGSYIDVYAECTPVAKMAQNLGLDPLLFDKHSSEDLIKNYLGFIN